MDYYLNFNISFNLYFSFAILLLFSFNSFITLLARLNCSFKFLFSSFKKIELLHFLPSIIYSGGLFTSIFFKYKAFVEV